MVDNMADYSIFIAGKSVFGNESQVLSFTLSTKVK